MSNAYQDDIIALKYLDFLNSDNGQIQQRVLLEAILKSLPKTHQPKILDAGCGPGWLAGALKLKFHNIAACDASEFFIKFARASHVQVDFKVADVGTKLPYPDNSFDVVILNMVGPDLENLAKAFKNIAAVLKPTGKIIMTLPNPKYTYPAAVWKRGVLGFLLRQKPRLIIKNTLVASGSVQRDFGSSGKISSYHYNLSDYILGAQKAGLAITQTREIRSQNDSPEFDLNYQLYRYPLLLLLELEKIQQ